jgi:hypothetical protein
VSQISSFAAVLEPSNFGASRSPERKRNSRIFVVLSLAATFALCALLFDTAEPVNALEGAASAKSSTAVAKPSAASKVAAASSKTAASAAKPAVRAASVAKTAAAKAPAAKPATTSAASQATSDDQSADADAAPAAPVPPHSDALAAKIAEYKSSPDNSTWENVLKEVRTFTQLPQTAKLSPALLFQANPGLTDVGTKLTDFAGGRIWSFPKVTECQHVVLQWANVVTGNDEETVVRGKRRVVRAAPQVLWRSEYLRVPAGVQLKEARFVSSSTVQTVGKKVVRTEGPRSLVLAGGDRAGSAYLHAFRSSGGGWTEVADVFSNVPPYVMQSLASKASFSGNDLVLSIGGTSAPAPSASADPNSDRKAPPPAASNGYRMVLKFVNGKYTMEGGKTGEDGALATAAQFAAALQQGKQDVAKAWLADPKLVSVPKYIGYFVKPMPQPKIVPMANPLNGLLRYRLITSLKEDLIIDVGRTKTLPFAVKGIFVAPPDPMAAKLVTTVQAHDSAAGASKDESKDDAGK